jgi:hypothetical protein
LEKSRLKVGSGLAYAGTMALKLRYKKKGDGSAAFTAVRGDGSSTTAQIGEAGGFGPVHDLAHYVVENQFGIKKGFLGLLASGWSIEDFNKGVVDRMIREGVIKDAGRAEVVAGLLSGDALSPFPLSVEDFNWTVQSQSAEIPSLSADELETLRQRLTTLRDQWGALNPGETLELSIDL